jgi:flagellar hook-length control protein FliK
VEASTDATPTDAAAKPDMAKAVKGDPSKQQPQDQGPETEAPLAPRAKKEVIAKTGEESPDATTDAATQAVARPDGKPVDLKDHATLDKPDVAAPQPVAVKTAPDLTATAKPQAAPPAPPEVKFAQDNHDSIVKGVQTQLLPRGGTMQIRLDPPELGAVNVILSIKDGVATASFQTSNEQATQLLSHSLSQLKTAMESTGVTVDKLQVQQAPKSQDSHSSKEEGQQGRGQPGGDEMARHQEQQRKEMLRRMWRRLNVGSDPLDLVA